MAQGTLAGHSFQGTFRDYQQRVLDASNRYLSDRKLHVVAAPGSGKTILGLELICRVGAPALVLAPTTAIRDQWAERFSQNFLQEGEDGAALCSQSLRSPKALTAVTYQTLHAAMRRKKSRDLQVEQDASFDDVDDLTSDTLDADIVDGDGALVAARGRGDGDAKADDFTNFDLIAQLKEQGVKTICLDEAHHLRTEWYLALVDFLSELGDVTLIALTATPPYGDNDAQWQRYEDLCGPIDVEISVPELVAVENLCPHQDFLYFAQPSASEVESVAKFESKVESYLAYLRDENFFSGALRTAKLTSEQWKDSIPLILANRGEFASLVALALNLGLELPQALVQFCLRGADSQISVSAAQEALKFVFSHEEIFGQWDVSELRTKAKELDVLAQEQVFLGESVVSARSLAASVGKLGAVEEIASAELESLNEGLRMVVLTDYIRKDQLDAVGAEDVPFTEVGAVPLFETLRRGVGTRCSLALLSGTLVVLPVAVQAQVQQIASDIGVEFSAQPLSAAPDYVELNVVGGNAAKVALVTQCLQQGAIQILVGTKALLGEGWDAPCINSLILATFVGSFMLSNQMRGRAIRIDKHNPNKVSNIWHLVTERSVEPRTRPLLAQALGVTGSGNVASTLEGTDYRRVAARFATFLAPAYFTPEIVSGTVRLQTLRPPFDAARQREINGETLALALDRERTRGQWQQALPADGRGEVTHCVEVRSQQLPAAIPAANRALVQGALLLQLLPFAVWAILEFSRLVRGIPVFIPLLGQVATLTILVLALLRWFQWRRSPSTIKKVVSALVHSTADAMFDLSLINSLQAHPNLTWLDAHQPLARGSADAVDFRVELRAATTREKDVFAQAIHELFAVPADPRYFLLQRGVEYDRALLSGKYAWALPVPECLAQKKETVAVLQAQLHRKLAALKPYRPVYASSEQGRIELWKAAGVFLGDGNESVQETMRYA